MKQSDKQYGPFTDFKSFAGFYWEDLENITPQGVAEIIKKRETKDSLVLEILIVQFVETSKKEGEIPALIEFWQLVEKLRKEGVNKSPPLLTPEMYSVLEKASRGDLKACQIIVRAHPDTIRLPFIMDIMVELIRKVKYARSDVPTLRDKWSQFLPSRPSRDIPYSEKSVRGLSKMVKQDKRVKLPTDKTGELLGISGESVRRASIKPERGRGRPKK